MSNKLSLIKMMKIEEPILMRTAKLVSNMKRPESDNNYGRAAVKLKEAREALEKLSIVQFPGSAVDL